MSISTINHNSFRMLFDKIASVYLFEKNILIFYRWKWPARGNGTVPIVSAHIGSLSNYFNATGRNAYVPTNEKMPVRY